MEFVDDEPGVLAVSRMLPVEKTFHEFVFLPDDMEDKEEFIHLNRLVNLHPNCKTFYNFIMHQISRLETWEKKDLINRFNKEFNINL